MQNLGESSANLTAQLNWCASHGLLRWNRPRRFELKNRQKAEYCQDKLSTALHL